MLVVGSIYNTPKINSNDSKTKIEVNWTGQFPNFCSGEWILKINDKDYSNLIPFRKNSPANTFGEFKQWKFNSNGDISWTANENGDNEEEWIQSNQDWLVQLPINKTYYKELYFCFMAKDWRYNSCGGCS